MAGLTVELASTGDTVEIHGTEEGLRNLCTVIQSLLRTPHNEHVHLFTPSWGGEELDEVKQGNASNSIINKVTLYSWKT